jgi:hypothetical protein
MRIYQQSTGKIGPTIENPAPRPPATEHEACGPTFQVEGIGYSGHGAGVNNPAMQADRDVGPIPRGFYEIGQAFDHPTRGPLVMRLMPRPGTDTFGRSGFLIHGDLKSAPGKHLASLGCIVLDHDLRARIAAAVASGDRLLQVIE